MEMSLSIYWNHDVLFLENTIRVRSWAAEATGPALVGIFYILRQSIQRNV